MTTSTAAPVAPYAAPALATDGDAVKAADISMANLPAPYGEIILMAVAVVKKQKRFADLRNVLRQAGLI